MTAQYPFNNDSTPAERREVIENDRKVQRSTTFKSFADLFANETKGGRHGQSDTGPTIKPIPSGPWSPTSARPGDEPALGHDINAVPDLGFQKRSGRAVSDHSPSVETATGGDERSATTSSSASDAPSPSLNDDPPKAA